MMQHICEICRCFAPLTYHRGLDEYICDNCWDKLPLQATDDNSEELDADDQ